MNGLVKLGELWHSMQTWLFPGLEDELGELDEKHREFVAVCETCAPQTHMAGYRWVGNGCPPSDRLALCKGFIAKAVWNFPTTRALIDALRFRPTLRRLCGWETVGEIPSEATFSRAFADFAHDQLPQRIHEAMIANRYGDKLAGHISRDGTAIHAREKAAKKETKEETAPKKRGRRRKGEPCPFARCAPALATSPSSTTTRAGARSASSHRRTRFATASGVRPSESTRTCTTATAGDTCGYAGR